MNGNEASRGGGYLPSGEYRNITQTIITGMICDIDNKTTAGQIVDKAETIMKMIERRYEMIQKPGNP